MAAPLTGVLRQSGSLFALALDVMRALPKRPFQVKEFIQQAWFIASVTILPTALVSSRSAPSSPSIRGRRPAAGARARRPG